MLIESFTTARLNAHRIREEDFDDYRRMRSDPRVAFWLGGQLEEPDQRRKHDEALVHWEEHGFGIWMLRMKETDEFVGRVGLRYSMATGINEVELLYVLVPDFWNHGLCTEASREVVRIAFEEVGLQELTCFTMTTNFASQRVMQKCGFIYERDFVYTELPHVLYRKKNLKRET